MNIVVDVANQVLELRNKENLLKKYSVSTSKNGTGQQYGSYCTPIGKHIVRAKIGAGCAINSVFVARRFTGDIYNDNLSKKDPERDWILTRILWLSGCEIGINRLGQVDTMRRFIYIHGSPRETKLGVPGSIGCIRMGNRDILQLFDIVVVGTEVEIVNFRE